MSSLALHVAYAVHKWTLMLCLFICLCAGIKKYVVGLIIKTSSDAATVEVSEAAQRHMMFTLMESVACL